MIPAQRTKSYTGALLSDADGIKTSFATVTSVVALAASDLNGAQIATGGVLDLPRTVSITLGNNAGAYTPTTPIVVTGRRGGSVVTASFAPTTADGNEVLHSTQLFDVITAVDIPAQADTDGSFTIGCHDVGAPMGSTIRVMAQAAGNLNLGYGKEGLVSSDIVAVPAVAIGFLQPVQVGRILASATNPTTIAVTVFVG